MADIKKRGLSIPEGYTKAGCGRSLFYKLLRDGSIPSRKIGSRRIVFDEDVDAYLDSLPIEYPKARREKVA